MASKARFGRLPRSAPSLTSTIVALAQEYQRVRESNIVDAWKNGGEFEGKKVTDDMVLKWMKDRRDELSPGDPKWNYYDNQVREYEFAIENSKMELKYKQKKASDGEMVAFYHKWANKLPPNSEAYREREKLAAAYADRAASGRASSDRAARDKAYANSLNGSYKKEMAYNATLMFLDQEAHNRGILKGGETLGNIDPTTADGHAIQALWDEIATAPEYADERKWYGDQIKANGDPTFNGDFSQDAFNAMTRTKKAAVSDRITTAKKEGRTGDIKKFTAEKDEVRGTQVLTGGFDETSLYEEARAEWLSTFTDPNATPLAVDRANTKYTAELTKIKAGLESGKGPGEVDLRLGAINNELKTMAGDAHPYEHWGGMFGPGGNTGGEGASETAAGINQNKMDIENLGLRDANGEPLYVLSKTGGGEPIATHELNHQTQPWAVVARSQMPDNTIYVVQNDQDDPRAGAVVTAVMPTPIMVVADVTDPTTGLSAPQQSATPAAYHYTLPDGKVGYKYKDGAGKWLYTPDNPFAGEPKITGKGGTVVVPGIGGGQMPATSSAMLPQYYDPAKNVAMTARIAKSGYGLWLISADPKDNSAYTQRPDQIIASMKMEAGNDPARLAEMVIDADARRAVYLGSSTEEQERIKQNARNGVPNPVSLASTMPSLGIKAPSAEQGIIDKVLAEAGIAPVAYGGGGPGGRREPMPEEVLGPHDLMRKYNMVSAPPPATALPTTAATSLGSTMPSSIAATLTDYLTKLTGKPTAPVPPGGALATSGYAGPLPTAPGATPPPAPTTPPPTTPPPTATTPTPKPFIPPPMTSTGKKIARGTGTPSTSPTLYDESKDYTRAGSR